MKRTSRVLVRVALVCALLLALGALALELASIDRLRAPIAAVLAQRLGRPVEILGPLHLDLGRELRLHAERVRLVRPPGQPGAARGEIDHVLLTLRLRRLLDGVVDIAEISLRDGRIELADPAAAPPDGAPPDAATPDADAAASAAAGPGFEIRVRELTARNLLIADRRRAGLGEWVRLDRLALRAGSFEDAIALSAAGEANGADFAVSGRLGSFAELRAPDRRFAIAFSGTVAGVGVDAEGGLEPQTGGRRLALRLSATAADLGHLGATERPELRSAGPVSARGVLADRDGTLGFEELEIRIGDAGDPVRATLTGALDDLAQLDEIALRVQLEALDLDALGRLLAARLPPVGPVSLSARLSGARDRLVAEELRGRLDQTQLAGRFTASFAPGARPSLDVRLEIPRLHLDDVGIAPAGEAAEVAPGSEAPAPDLAALLAGLPAVDATLVVASDRVEGRGDVRLEDLRARVELREGRLSLDEFGFSFDQGTVSAQGSLRAESEGPVVALRADASGVRLQRMMAQLQQTPVLAGVLDLSLDLQSRGARVAELRSHVSGDLRAMVRDGRAASGYLAAFQRKLSDALRLGDDADASEALQCLIADFHLDQGVAEARALWLETESTLLAGEGAIDLARDAFALLLTPRPKRRGLLSVAPQVRVTGPLADPRFSAIKRTLATSAARGVFQSLTRTGDPLLSVFWRRQGGEAGPCAEAFAPAP